MGDADAQGAIDYPYRYYAPPNFYLVVLLACWLPARRAARVDPMEALRYE